MLAAAPSGARELWRSGEASLAWSGSARELAVVTGGTDADAFAAAAAPCLDDPAGFAACPAFDLVGERTVATSLTRLRQRLDLRAGPRWSAVLVHDLELRGGRLDTFEAELGDAFARQSFLRVEGEVAGGSRASLRHRLYRGYLLFEARRFELVLGRQRIPWGVGRLWNPIDRFNPIGPLALEADQSGGADAVLARWLPGGQSAVEAVFAPARALRDSAGALRLHGVLRDVDVSLVAGVFDEAWTAGLDLAANLGGAAVRAEVVFTDPEREVRPLGSAAPREVDRFWQVVVSADYVFDLGTGLYALVEHLYNGGALGFGSGRAGGLLPFFEATDRCPPPLSPPCVTPSSADRFGGARVVTGARHLTGVELGYDLSPELRGGVLALVDGSGGSASFFPSLRYAPTGWLELTLAAQLFTGPRRSEFGAREHLGFLLAEVFF